MHLDDYGLTSVDCICDMLFSKLEHLNIFVLKLFQLSAVNNNSVSNRSRALLYQSYHSILTFSYESFPYMNATTTLIFGVKFPYSLNLR